MAASYQAYRNLNKPGFFSVKHKGLVVDYAETMIMKDCKFHIGEIGRVKVVRDRRKHVHAWVLGISYKKVSFCVDEDEIEEVWYPLISRRVLFQKQQVLCSY